MARRRKSPKQKRSRRCSPVMKMVGLGIGVGVGCAVMKAVR